VPISPPRIEFYTASGGQRLALRKWNAPQQPAARVVLLHGITSHGGWYDQSAEFLAASGVEVAFLDRRGSGLNGELIADVESWRTWVDDVAAFIDPTLPTFVCGISWGGKLAAAVARTYPGLIAGVGLICPGIYSPYMPGPLKRLLLAAPAPARLQQRRLKIPLQRPELFTNSLKWREFIATDPLALRTVTWRFAQEDRKLTRYARESAAFLHMPTLVILAGQDRIVENSRTRDFFGRLPSRHKTLIEYGNAAHTLEFERDPSRYFNDLASWIEQTVAARV
jgi:alpha-beta hydrolase superfamily lysophospholipase